MTRNIGRPIAYQPLFGDGGSAGIKPERGDCDPEQWIEGSRVI